MAKATAAQTNDLKTQHGMTDAQIVSCGAIPGFSFAALIALLEKFATSGLSLADILALFGIA